MKLFKPGADLPAFMRMAVELEQRWAPKMGAPAAQELTGLIGFALGRLNGVHGVAWDDLDAYLSESIAALRMADL